MKILISTIVALVLVGCASSPTTQVVTMSNEFHPLEGAYVHAEGSHSLAGNAFLMTRGGDPKTCAGQDVWILPATPYAQERFVHWRDGADLPEAPAEFEAQRRQTVCNSDGRFVFHGLTEGPYLVLARVDWEAPEVRTNWGNVVSNALSGPYAYKRSTREVVNVQQGGWVCSGVVKVPQDNDSEAVFTQRC